MTSSSRPNNNWQLLTSAIRIYISKASTYRANFQLMLLLFPLQLSLSLGLWWAVTQGQTVADLSWREAIAYFTIMATLTRLFPFGQLTQHLSTSIYKGDLTVQLSRPLPVWLLPLAEMLANAIITLMTATPLLIIATIISGQTSIHSPLFIPLLLAGFIIQFWLYYMIGLTAFWIEKVSGVLFSTNLTVAFLSGSQLPLSIFPHHLEQIIWWTPFPYLYYLPTQVLLGKQTLTATQLALSVFYPILFSALGLLMTRRGLKQFTGHGT